MQHETMSNSSHISNLSNNSNNLNNSNMVIIDLKMRI